MATPRRSGLQPILRRHVSLLGRRRVPPQVVRREVENRRSDSYEAYTLCALSEQTRSPSIHCFLAFRRLMPEVDQNLEHEYQSKPQSREPEAVSDAFPAAGKSAPRPQR